MRGRLSASWLGLCLLAALATTDAAAQERADAIGPELEDLSAEAGALTRSVAQLEEQYLQAEEILRRYTFANAYLDARYLFGIGSTDAVVELLLPLVEDPEHHGDPGFGDMVFLLAESLFVQQDYLMSRRYYTWLAQVPEHALDATRRLIELALAMGRYDALEALFVDLERLGGAGAGEQIAYVRGKALYFQGHYAEAADAFRGVAPGTELYGRARYFAAVCQARMQRLEEAHAELDRVLAMPPSGEEEDEAIEADLADLARLAKGRLFYETRDWVGAIDQYAFVDRASARYPAALYEIAWSQIRLGSESDEPEIRQEYLGAALQSLEFLELIVDQESRFLAQAQLLRGDILMRMARYEDAVVEFEAAAETYFPVEMELREIREQHDDPDLFFDAVVNPDTGSLRLPLAARPWFDSDPQLDRALRAIADVATLREDIAETRQLVEELDAVLNGGGLINAFPRLREGWGLMTEAQMRATRLLIALVDLEGRVVGEALDRGDRGEFQRLRDARMQLQAVILAQPRTFSELGEREQAVIDRLNELILDVHRTELRIQAAREDLDALREIYLQQIGAAPSESFRTLRADIDAEVARLDRQEEAAERLRRELMLRQVAIGISDDVLAAERDARREFIGALAAEQRYLAQHRSLVPEAASALDEVSAVIGTAVSVDQRCEAFFVAARDIVAGQTAELRDLLERERANVERYEQEIVIAEAAARTTAGDVAIGAFEDVYQRFTDLTVRANLGVIDVAWQRKEEVTRAIERLYRERDETLEALDEARPEPEDEVPAVEPTSPEGSDVAAPDTDAETP